MSREDLQPGWNLRGEVFVGLLGPWSGLADRERLIARIGEVLGFVMGAGRCVIET